MMHNTIIIIHRSPGRVTGCLDTIRASTGGEYRLVVIDAGQGRDRSAAIQARTHGQAALQVIRCNGGRGAVSACNAVLKRHRRHQVIILDSTVRVTGGWTEALGGCLDQAPRAGLVGPLMATHYAGLPPQFCNVNVAPGSAGDLNAARQVRHRGQRVAARIPWAGCLAGRVAMIQALGCLDETCPDIDVALADLCLRAQMAGYQNYLAGDIYVTAGEQPAPQRWHRVLRDKWESLDPESNRRKHYEALRLGRRAEQACRREELDQAIEFYLKGIGLFPAAENLYLELADLLAEAGRFEDALQTLREIPGNDPNPAAAVLTGVCHRGLGKPDRAHALVDHLLAERPQSATGWWLKGVLHKDAGHRSQAVQAFEKSIALDPGIGAAYTELGNLALEKGDSEKALELQELGFSLSPDTGGAATAYHTTVSRLQCYRQAIPIFAEAAALGHPSRRLCFLLIDLLLKAGKPDLAMAVIEKVLVDFRFEEGLLGAALAVREQLGAEPFPENGDSLCFCLIVRDEERDLPRCLYSIKPVADEIVVVDTGSQDRTRDIARVFGARVYDFEWCDDFAAAKNFAAQQARARWIFSIDADEVLSPFDYEALLLLLQRPASDPVAYAVTTRNYLKLMDVIGWQPNDGHYPEEAGLGWMPSEKVRLFPNDRRVHFVYPVHEMVEPSLEAAGIKILACDIPVHHYGKLNHARSLAKGESYYKIGLKKLEALQDSPAGIRELAIQAQTLGDYPEAARLWEHLLTLETGQGHTYLNLGTVYLELGKYAKAQQMARLAHKMDPSIKESHFNLALSMFYMGDAGGAIGILEKLVKQQPAYFAARFILAAACCCAGEDEQARANLGKLKHTSIAAGLPEAVDTLIQGMEKAGQYAFARAMQTLIPV